MLIICDSGFIDSNMINKFYELKDLDRLLHIEFLFNS